MEDEKIMKNMKEVLKRTKKRGRKHKQHSSQQNSSIDDELGDKLMRNWVFSSPPMNASNNESKPTDETCSKTINAFDRLMSKRTEPLTPISPEINGVKKKPGRKFKRQNSMKSNLDDEENTSIDHSTKSIKKFFNGNIATPEDVGGRKRNLSEVEMPIETSMDTGKRRKTRREKVELDSNENIEDTPSRPRRSCAGKVNYGLLLSPEKQDVKKSLETVEIVDDSPKKPKKIAPLFMKKVPKPSIDPAVKEARR